MTTTTRPKDQDPSRAAARPRVDRCAAAMLLAAVLLSPAVMNDAPLLTPGAADAARDAPQGPPNAAQQRKEIIERLDAIDERLESLEGAMSDGLNVRVVNFPDDSGEDDSDRAADTTDRTPRVRRTGG